MAEDGYKYKKKAKQFFHERRLIDEIKDCSLVAAAVQSVLMKSFFIIQYNCCFGQISCSEGQGPNFLLLLQ